MPGLAFKGDRHVAVGLEAASFLGAVVKEAALADQVEGVRGVSGPIQACRRPERRGSVRAGGHTVGRQRDIGDPVAVIDPGARAADGSQADHPGLSVGIVVREEDGDRAAGAVGVGGVGGLDTACGLRAARGPEPAVGDGDARGFGAEEDGDFLAAVRIVDMQVRRGRVFLVERHDVGIAAAVGVDIDLEVVVRVIRPHLVEQHEIPVRCSWFGVDEHEAAQVCAVPERVSGVARGVLDVPPGETLRDPVPRAGGVSLAAVDGHAVLQERGPPLVAVRRGAGIGVVVHAGIHDQVFAVSEDVEGIDVVVTMAAAVLQVIEHAHQRFTGVAAFAERRAARVHLAHGRFGRRQTVGHQDVGEEGVFDVGRDLVAHAPGGVLRVFRREP